jgi:uncharacterized protein (TIGR02246 family)
MTETPMAIATGFVQRWAESWNSGGPAACAALYTPDAVLVGAAMGIGRHDIERLLTLLYKQGWPTVAVKVVDARQVGGVVLAACEFAAQGAGANEGKELYGKSSHVLTPVDGTWLSAMHSAA